VFAARLLRVESGLVRFRAPGAVTARYP